MALSLVSSQMLHAYLAALTALSILKASSAHCKYQLGMSCERMHA